MGKKRPGRKERKNRETNLERRSESAEEADQGV
jgi:hypothetical protein